MESDNYPVEVVFSVGSNCGDRGSRVSGGISWLEGFLSECRVSSVYTTGDCHGGKRVYVNAVVAGLCDMSRERIETLCKEYEISCGRTSEARLRGDVPVDIDLVIFDGAILRPKDYRQKFFQIGFMQL